MNRKICKNDGCDNFVPKDRGGKNKTNCRNAKFCSDKCNKNYWLKQKNKKNAEKKEIKKRNNIYRKRGRKINESKMNTDLLQRFLCNKF